MSRRMSMMLFAAALTILVAAPDAAMAQGRRRRPSGPGRGPDDNSTQGSLKAGQTAPDFQLFLVQDQKKAIAKASSSGKPGRAQTSSKKKKDGGAIKLSSFRGKKPVVLLFGSYT